MISSSVFIHKNKNSIFHHTEPISSDYRVFLNGEEIPVYTCRVSKFPFNRTWPGHQRSFDQTEQASFVNIVTDEKIRLEVIVNRPYEKVMVRPYSKGIVPTCSGEKVSFSIEKEGQYVFSCDDLHCSLFLFVSQPIAEPDPTAVAHYFGPGIHFPGKITLKDNESVFIHKDALVYGGLYAENAKNIRIFGNGIFDDSTEERVAGPCYENMCTGNLRFFDCENVNIEGVSFRNSAIWCVSFFHCFQVELKNIKVFGQWRYNTDGVDFTNCQNIVLRDSFIHSFDDSVCIKGIDRYISTSNENILVENCVLWCDWGRACEIGLETACRACKNITFRNCDLIRSGNVALDIQNGDCAEVSDVLFENIRVEYNSYDQIPQLQKTDEDQYQDTKEFMIPALISISNYQFRQMEFYKRMPDIWKKFDALQTLDFGDTPRSVVHDIAFRDIQIFWDESLPSRNGEYPIPIKIHSSLPGVQYYNIAIFNVTVNAKPVQKEHLQMSVTETKSFTFDSSFA